MINDCFAVQDRLMSLEEAFARIAERVQPVTAIEMLPVTACLGRVLAKDVVSPITQASFANSAMDGFACRAADLAAEGPTRLPILGRVAAGHPLKDPVPAGGAVEIFTGAPLPDGLDTVSMVEDCRIEETEGRRWVVLPAGLARGNFVRPIGEDFFAGTTVLSAGRRLRPQDLAMAAAVGRPQLAVRRPLRVGVLSTGDEVVEPGRPLGEGQVYSSNRYGQMAVLENMGFAVTDLGHLPDDLPTTLDAFARAAESQDAIVTSGGVSLGGEDHVKAAAEQLGRLHLWRLAIKPGKPVALGTIGKASFIGLPGYPVSAIVTLLVAGRAPLLRLSGALAEPPLPPALPIAAGFTFKKGHKRRQFLRASIVWRDGRAAVVPYRTQESSVLSSLVDSTGLVDVGADVSEIREGDLVPFLPYESLMR
jgi:molybdopterin molybdotransferase